MAMDFRQIFSGCARRTIIIVTDALVAYPGNYVDSYSVYFDIVSVVPAFNLNLSSDIFASAADAASSSYSGYKANSAMTENTYTLRYTYTTGTDSAVINPSGTQVKVTNANNKYLMVQNSTGVYALEINSDDKTINASDIQMGSNAEDKLDNFNNCKVWIESTDANRITTAKMATQATVTTINSVEVTGIIAPMVDATFDTKAACATTGISSTTPTVTWTPNVTTAGYNTTYTASVTLTTADNYEFASGVTATVNGQNATGVTKNSDGTVTVTYSYKTVAKTVSNAYYATADDLKDCYNIGDGTIGKIRFGLNGSDARLWAICGADTDGSLSLLSTSEFAQAAYGSTSEYSSSNFVNNLKTDSNGYLSTTYFSTGEMGKMADVTVSTNEPDTTNGGNHTISVENKKLYLPNSQDQNIYGTTIYVGSSNNIAVNVTKLNGDNGFQTNLFWLRSPYNDYSISALVAFPGYSVRHCGVYFGSVSVVPALNLNLSSDIFASAADAASSSYSGYKANSVMTANTYTLRYTYTDGTDSAVINPSGTQVKVTGASDKYLMVQNSTGVYALAITSADQTVNASDIIMGSALTTFDGCKVWIESTDADRITTAKLATQATAINSVAVTDITAPVAGSTFDTTSACATRGVYTTVPTVTWKQGDVSATGNAGYNTTYTASVTLTKTDDYEFAAGVTATVNGQNATSVVKNGDGTVTITYTFPATAKAKLTNITAPTGITVASGTAYANMGLPNNVAIVTEGNTETTAAVVWNTTTPASGSYNPEVLTQQSVTLNGTVTCPSNIDQNSVPLTTTITVTISAAGIVGAPTFVPAAGTYTENQSVSLSSSTDGATIYYTTDGTTPTAASNVYSGAITVTGIPGERISTTIKAIAVKPGMQNSSVASAAYVIELPAPAPSTYAVTVNNGTGDGCYTAGATVTITADTASSGHEFDKWTVVSGGVTLASATSATTTFEMPANAVEVTATYKNKPSDQNPPTPTYTITAGAGGTHELSTDGTLTITCAGSLDKLTGIYVDDKLVNASNYTLKSRSTILTFNATYLNTLSVGTHK
ncbi:MAG: chitobiase/beta-hexosaminidase C-terminal domain-containing protein [Mageeibacillus sp.]|jgi:hypothetical protein|nr:chitobiase/beta-hexosaminidase C-terminal domain-containing protein [Mageeibacillus sp.]